MASSGLKVVDVPTSLSNTGFAPDPDVVGMQVAGQGYYLFLSADGLYDVLGTFQLWHMAKGNVSVFDQGLQIGVQNQLVLGGALLLALSFHVLVQGLLSELKRAFNPGVLLHAIGGCSIINANRVPVRVLTNLLHGGNALPGLWQAYVELYMYSPFCSFLQLAYCVDCFGACVDGFQPVLQHEIGILLSWAVKRTNESHELRGLNGH